MMTNKLSNRAFTVRAITKGFRRKIVGYVISDGLNEIKLGAYDWFVIYTNKPINEPIIKKR